MWSKYVQPKIFSRVKKEGMEALGDEFPNLFYTTSNQNLTTPKFPTVYLHMMSGTEQAQTLSGKGLNAFLCTVQVEVTDNKSAVNAEEVMDKVVETMKSMGFSIVATPETQFYSNVHRCVARFRRLVCSMDKF